MKNQVNPENDEITLEIVTVTRLTVPKGTSVAAAASGNGHGAIILPTGEELRSYVVLERDEIEDLTTMRLEELGCSCEDISREINEVENGDQP